MDTDHVLLNVVLWRTSIASIVHLIKLQQTGVLV